MNALETNRYTEAWRAFGAAVPRHRAVLVISAHWYINATAVTAMPRPRTIHDFFGFPEELFDVDYPAPGLPELAEEISDLVSPTWIGADVDSCDYHLDLGARLAPLRNRGVLILGSGNLVYNLRAADFSRPDAGYDWARRFDEAARDVLTRGDPAGLAALDKHHDYRGAVPTADHFLPALYLAGLADMAHEKAQELIGGCVYGSLSLASYVLGMPVPSGGSGASPAPGAPTDAPPERSSL